MKKLTPDMLAEFGPFGVTPPSQGPLRLKNDEPFEEISSITAYAGYQPDEKPARPYADLMSRTGELSAADLPEDDD